VTAAELKRDALDFPKFYGEDVLLPEGQTPAYLGQAVAILIYQDFARFRFAKEKLQFNDAVVRYGEVTGPLQRDPWGSSRFVRVGGKSAYDEDVFSAMKQGPISPSYDNHEPVWPKPARDGDVGAQGMYQANRIDGELVHPPADWLVLTRDYATQSGDTAALEPDCANAWYDAARPRSRCGGARLQSLAMGAGRFHCGWRFGARAGGRAVGAVRRWRGCEKTCARYHSQPVSGAGSPDRVVPADAEQQRDGWLQ
jgi:CO/xanthine dehydrogenase Mo-binding subunit